MGIRTNLQEKLPESRFSNYLPNTNVPPQNYPIMNNKELIDNVQEYPNPNAATDKYFNQNAFEKKTRNGEDYFASYFSGPIRSAGGTEAAFALVVIDYLREIFGYAKYDPTKPEPKDNAEARGLGFNNLDHFNKVKQASAQGQEPPAADHRPLSAAARLCRVRADFGGRRHQRRRAGDALPETSAGGGADVPARLPHGPARALLRRGDRAREGAAADPRRAAAPPSVIPSARPASLPVRR
mgnify:CR=1 FL=1